MYVSRKKQKINILFFLRDGDEIAKKIVLGDPVHPNMSVARMLTEIA
jgi:hypothetical protein